MIPARADASIDMRLVKGMDYGDRAGRRPRAGSRARDMVKLPTMGGSLPLEAIVRTFDTPVINIHLSNPDNNNHSANENLRLQNLWDGIETMAMLLQM